MNRLARGAAGRLWAPARGAARLLSTTPRKSAGAAAFPWKEADPYAPENVLTPGDIYPPSDMLGHEGATRHAPGDASYAQTPLGPRAVAGSASVRLALGLGLAAAALSAVFPTHEHLVGAPETDSPALPHVARTGNPVTYLLSKAQQRKESIYAGSHQALVGSLEAADDAFITNESRLRKHQAPMRMYTDSWVHKCSSVGVPLGSAADTRDFSVKHRDAFSARLAAGV